MNLCEKLKHSIGAIHIILSYLEDIQVLKLQFLDKWWYQTGVSRIQVSLAMTKYDTYDKVYLISESENKIHVYDVTTKRISSLSVPEL